MLCGFFGGTGGHLHHMGVVLMDTNNMAAAGVATDTNTPIAASMPVSNTFPRILSLCEELRMSECGMLRYYESHYGASMSRQSNIVHLAGRRLLGTSLLVIAHSNAFHVSASSVGGANPGRKQPRSRCRLPSYHCHVHQQHSEGTVSLCNVRFRQYCLIPPPLGPHRAQVPDHQADQPRPPAERAAGARRHRASSLRPRCLPPDPLRPQHQPGPAGGAVRHRERDPAER